MSAKWTEWQSDLERISPFSQEWNEGLAEDFIQSLQGIVTRKRAQRETMVKLGDELGRLRTAFSQTLAFFQLERDCQSWSARNCPEGELDRALDLLGELGADLLRRNGEFPPPEVQIHSYAALQECCLKAANAISEIRPGFQILNDLLAEQAEEGDAPAAPCLETPVSVVVEPGEAAA
jgi:hypothetical protein